MSPKTARPRGRAQNHAAQPDLFRLARGEIWLAHRLREHGCRIDDGVTDLPTRRERIRRAILGYGLATAIAGRGPDRKPETYRALFARLYGEPL